MVLGAAVPAVGGQRGQRAGDPGHAQQGLPLHVHVLLHVRVVRGGHGQPRRPAARTLALRQLSTGQESVLNS